MTFEDYFFTEFEHLGKQFVPPVCGTMKKIGVLQQMYADKYLGGING